MAREAQKNQPKTGKVYTDDDLTSLKGGVSIVGGQPEAAPTDAAAASADQPKPAAKGQAKDEAYWRRRFADARRKLADDSKELDVLQREYNVKQLQYYSNPDVALREQYSREDLNQSLAAIDAKKQDIDNDKKALDDLQDELRTSGGEPGWATEQAPSDSGSGSPTEATSDSSQTSSQSDQQSAPADATAPTATSGDHSSEPKAAPLTLPQ